MGIGWVIKKGDQELPQLKRASPLVRGPLSIQGGLLLDLACREGPHVIIGVGASQGCAQQAVVSRAAARSCGWHLTFQSLRHHTGVIKV